MGVFQPSFVDLGPKLGVLQKAKWESPKMAKIQPGGRKTARRAAERPPTGKPKLSRVTSGCGEDIIPLSRVRETTKNGGYHGRSVKKCRFSGQKWAPAAAPRPAVRRSQHKKVVFLVSRHDGIKKFGRRLKKIDLGPKNSIFGQKISFFLRYTHITPLFWART